MSGTSHDGWEHGSRGVVSGKPGFAHSRAIVHYQSCYVLVTHCEGLSGKSVIQHNTINYMVIICGSTWVASCWKSVKRSVFVIPKEGLAHCTIPDLVSYQKKDWQSPTPIPLGMTPTKIFRHVLAWHASYNYQTEKHPDIALDSNFSDKRKTTFYVMYMK